MITSVVQEGVPGIVLPEAANLSFQCGPLLKDRLAELRKQLPAPPPAKRPRTGTGVLVGAPADLPNHHKCRYTTRVLHPHKIDDAQSRRAAGDVHNFPSGEKD